MHVTKYNQKMRSSQTKICQFLEKMEEKQAKPRTAVADQQKLNETIVVSSCSRRWSGHLLNKIKARNKDNTPLCTSKQQNAQITKQNDTRSFSLFTCIKMNLIAQKYQIKTAEGQLQIKRGEFFFLKKKVRLILI